jgi:hypothetical protein
MAWWDSALGGGQDKPRPQPPAHAAGRSVYEDRAPVAFASEPEAGWRRIGEIDPTTGAWRDGPRWIEVV